MDFSQIAAQQEAHKQREFFDTLVAKLDGLIKQVATLEAKVDLLRPLKAAKE